MMIDYKSLAERIRQTLAEGGNCELSTEEWRAVADLLERQAADSVKVEKALERIKSFGLKDEIRDADDILAEMKYYTLFEIADEFRDISNLLYELRDLLESEEITE
jgi:hypothetical protein